MSRTWARRALALGAALTLLAACGRTGGSDRAVSGGGQQPVSAPGATSSKGATKLTAALQQQVATAGVGAPAQGLPYSGGAPTRSDGRMEVVFHGAGPVGTAELDGLKALGAEIVQTLAPDPLVPRAGLVVAWVPPDQVLAAAAADWVTAVTPPGTSLPR